MSVISFYWKVFMDEEYGDINMDGHWLSYRNILILSIKY